jgi:phosphatidylserine/phosphatidylglycerophosphate/cardiolipin synthase-like enzyme
MNPELTRRLEQSFDARPMSRAERRSLAEFLATLDRDELRGEARSEAFRIAREAHPDGVPPDVLEWVEDVMKALLQATPPAPVAADAEAWFSPRQDCARRIVQLLSAARASIDVCVFTITDDRIAEALLDARRRGLALRVVTDDDKAFDLGSDVERLRAAGVPVRVDRTRFHMHHKFAIVDAASLLTGSYNWTRGAARDNEENFIITADRRLVEPFAHTFEALWKGLA